MKCSITKNLVGSEDERAVSPVIGVILMVAITVILAAVIAAFVLDIGDLDDSAPSAQYNWETDDDEIVWSHQSGDNIDMGDISVTVTYADSGQNEGDLTSNPGSADTLSGDFTAGDSVSIEVDSTDDHLIVVDGETALEGNDGNSLDIDDVEEVTVTWESDSSSTIISEYEP